MSKRAVHMYEWDGGTEADQDPPEDVLCGTDGEMEDEQLTSNWGNVTCKRCLKIREKQLARWAAEDRDKKVALFDEAQAITRELGYRNIATAIKALRRDAERYQWLRSRDLETISQGGVFAGITPQNMVLNEETLDQAVDAAMTNEAQP